MDRSILHSDINSCFASIERLYHPELEGKAFAVCGDAEKRHGIVLAKNDAAKKCGVKTAMAIWQARSVCPELVIVEPHYDRYVKYSKLIREIYAEYTDLVEPFGIDECWLDITNCYAHPDAEKAAHEIRQRVKNETGLTVSVGVSWNKVFAKLGSDYKKPDAVTVLNRDNFKELAWVLPADDMIMVGRSTMNALKCMGIKTIGDLANTDPRLLKARLGKAGLMLYLYANGLDESRVRRIGEEEPPKSIGNSTTGAADIESAEQAKRTLLMLADTVSSRLREGNFLCRTLELSLRDTELKWQSHRMRLYSASDICTELAHYGSVLLNECHEFPKPIRSMGLRALELVHSQDGEQVDIFIDYENRMRQRSIDAAMDKIRAKYGKDMIQRASIFGERPAPSLSFSPLSD